VDQPIRLEKKKAHETPRGTPVVMNLDGIPVVCLKVERQGKEYVHHYVVPIDPSPRLETPLIYVDPDLVLHHWAGRLDFTLGGGAGAGPEVGHIVTNAVGTFLKVIEDPKSQKMFAFVEISSGVVKSRQERGVTSVHLDWRVSGWGDGGAVGLDMLRDAFEKL